MLRSAYDLDGLAAGINKVLSKAAQFGSCHSVLGRMREHGLATCVTYPLNDGLESRPLGLDVAGLAGAKVLSKRRPEVADAAILDELGSEMRPADRRPVRAREHSAEVQLKAVLPESLSDRARPFAARALLVIDRVKSGGRVGIHVEPDDVNCPARPLGRQFNARDERNAGGQLETLVGRQRIVIGDRQEFDVFVSGGLEQLHRRKCAVRGVGMSVQVDLHGAKCIRQAFRQASPSRLWDTPRMSEPAVNRANLLILIVCQLISATGSIVIVTLAGIIGSGLTDNPALSTLPVSMTIVAVALTTVPATMLMRTIGRARGFALASLSAVLAVCVATAAIYLESFVLFVIAGMLFGINMAFTQQYRYAAAESVPPGRIAMAISFVLVGSIGGALVGPELATRGQDWIPGLPYGGTMLSLAALYALQAFLLINLEAVETTDRDVKDDGRALGEIVRQPVYVVAVLGGTVGYGLMTLVMTATPISMHIYDGHTIEQTANVIRAHVLGMYVPSLFSGFLIQWLGVTRLMYAGAVILLATSIIGLQGQSVLHYGWALVMLGVGWNFMYVGGTTMLAYTYTLEERFRAQAVNEFLVFGSSAATSLLAGTMMHLFGWTTLMLIPMPILLAVGIALLLVRRNPVLVERLNAS